MKTLNIRSFHWLSQSKFWLLSLTVSLAVIYLTVLLRSKDIAHFGMSVLFFLVVISLFREKPERLNFKSSFWAKVMGGLIILIFLVNFPFVVNKNQLSPILRSAPFAWGLGLSLIAFGLQRTKQYWRELLILFCLGIPSLMLSKLLDLSVFAAQFSGFILQWIHKDVVREGVYLYFPNATIEVNKGCSGLEAITYLLGIAVILLILFPLKQIHNLIVPIIAVSLAFVVNGLRVVLMSLLVADNRMDAFKYWHEGEGSLVVGMIAVVIFVAFYWQLIRRNPV